VDWSQAGVAGDGDKRKSERWRDRCNRSGIRCRRVVRIVCFVFDGFFLELVVVVEREMGGWDEGSVVCAAGTRTPVEVLGR